MYFPESYFEDEVRDGFYVPSMMKRAWAAQLEVLEDIDKVCKKHGIKYFADWGTVLGAVRHGGFVPWDDDMDICMLRKDYEKFCQVALDELPDIYGLLNFEHSDDGEYKCDDYLTRVYTGNRIRLDKAYLDKFHGFPYVSGMDVFPLDYMGPTKEDDEMMCEQVAVLTTLACAVDSFDEKEKEKCLSDIEHTFDVKLDRTKSLRKQIYMLSDRLCGAFDESQSEYITSMALRSNVDYKVPKACYEDVVMLPFENTEIPVPVGYDSILRIKYGDYMKPVRDGGAHEYPFYKRQQVTYEEKNPPLIKEYTYNPNMLETAIGEESVSLKDIARNMLDLFEQAHASIVMAGEEGNWQEVVYLTEDCQDGAIALGTKIEEVKGEGNIVVKILEEYCELLYSIHETILADGSADINVVADILNDIIYRMKLELEKNLFNRKEIVFLPFKYDYWESFRSVWKTACDDPEADVYVIPIPYCNKGVDGSKSEFHCDADRYPENIKICDYNTFDFGLHHPDMIYIQNPYDDYNVGISVHPFFYSSNLKQYTDKLIYIPYFTIDEIRKTDERAVNSLAYFCTTPGVVNADIVFVQSESMRQSYIEALTKFAGEETKAIWEEKIVGLGAPAYDDLLEEYDLSSLPADWKHILCDESGNKKKTILYYAGLGQLLEHEMDMIEKMKRSFAIMKENKNVALIWNLPEKTCKIIEKSKPQLWNALWELIEEYKAKGYGIFDDAADIKQIVPLCDGYYGDASSYISYFKSRKLPVMVQKIDI